jgi:hypothetical protein
LKFKNNALIVFRKGVKTSLTHSTNPQPEFSERAKDYQLNVYLKDSVSTPPAKPGALRLLAPQRGLIAIDQNQNREAFMVQPIANSFSRFRVAFHLPGMTILLPKMSNFASPPAEPGVYLDAN